MRSRLVTCAVALVFALATTGLHAQAPPGDARPSFEAASIRQNVSSETLASIRALPGGRVTVTNLSLRGILRTAYTLPDFQIVGGPDWVDRDRWDIVAKADGDLTPQQMIPMVRELLADRFGLVVRAETRELPIYTLEVARNGSLGSRLRRSEIDCEALYAAAKKQGGTPPPRADGRPLCGTRRSPGTMMTTAVTTEQLAQNLSQIVERPVVDRTGLEGAWDLDLEWAPDQTVTPSGSTPPAGPLDGVSFFTALREQLGLTLASGRGPVDVLVIESVERPTED